MNFGAQLLPKLLTVHVTYDRGCGYCLVLLCTHLIFFTRKHVIIYGQEQRGQKDGTIRALWPEELISDYHMIRNYNEDHALDLFKWGNETLPINISE